jgi:hypothetical protein
VGGSVKNGSISYFSPPPRLTSSPLPLSRPRGDFHHLLPYGLRIIEGSALSCPESPGNTLDSKFPAFFSSSRYSTSNRPISQCSGQNKISFGALFSLMGSSLCPKFQSNPMGKSLDFMKIGFICRCPETLDVLSGYSGQFGRSIRTYIRTLRIIRNPASISFSYCL